MILIPYIQNAWDGPGAGTWMYFFMGYTKYVSDVYFYLISMGMGEGILITLFLQSLFHDLQEGETTKFDLNN